MTAEDIVAFAERHDPQPFHLSDEGARNHPFFEGLCASGWHTGLVMHGMLDCFWRRATKIKGLAGGGIEQLRWLRPVYAGDVLDCELELTQVRASRSRPERGLVTMRITARKADGEAAAVLVMIGVFAAE
jgi:acyl dehydratase